VLPRSDTYQNFKNISLLVFFSTISNEETYFVAKVIADTKIKHEENIFFYIYIV